ncbi:hypothetical protein PFDSM3638_05090 [Pyrococcus furiosus DSM 3638]|uniref:Uncharacterized protein n=4 Tax=Thermococcaceae TaxID=2259 RepID=A0A5C0XNE0_PYRFU|nr:hypothetical protein PF1013 [Pyrococcus furiosus DSM 3638]AFN03808.1 hypothetical protein PFC_04295 [Pyrococcus furiosus COM1]MDK2870050.1 hypothetical protein [Pyrococcus sp.]QEK78676.1 hypothetical protein PFDSM3638_05090 [Pyrococcus furiosus DSM 3638]
MRRVSVIILTIAIFLAIGLAVDYITSTYGSINYEWKTSFKNYHTYNLAGNSVLNGYIMADGNISVYILTKEDFKKMKNGEFFSYYKAWEKVQSVEFNSIKIPSGEHILVVKNEGQGRRWISAKIVNKKE